MKGTVGHCTFSTVQTLDWVGRPHRRLSPSLFGQLFAQRPMRPLCCMLGPWTSRGFLLHTAVGDLGYRLLQYVPPAWVCTPHNTVHSAFRITLHRAAGCTWSMQLIYPQACRLRGGSGLASHVTHVKKCGRGRGDVRSHGQPWERAICIALHSIGSCVLWQWAQRLAWHLLDP